MDLDLKKDLLFIGYGQTAVMWYRCALPAMKIGCDYVGLDGDPPDLDYCTGIVRGKSQKPNPFEYKVVVIQQAKGRGWLKIIQELQAAGIVVIYEVDDWLHAIGSQKDHDYRESFDRLALSDYEMCMKAADAMIVSTDFLARTYRAFNREIHVCENGVDIQRYDLKMPIRRSTNIGWAGATGHRLALTPWLKVVAKIMRRRRDVNVVTIGQDYANAFHQEFGLERAVAVPFAAIEQYPAAMTNMDIAIAPAARTGFFMGKSDLRWLEAGALGIPIVAHPLVYPKIEHGINGFHASTPQQIEDCLDRLIENVQLRWLVGQNAQHYVRTKRSAEVVAKRWEQVIQEVWTKEHSTAVR